MIYSNIAVHPHSIKSALVFTVQLFEDKPVFPLFAIDRDSYIVSAQIQSGIDYNMQAGLHNILIGRYCSIADDITFLVDVNHDFNAVTTSAASFLEGCVSTEYTKRKGQIIIKNDVWVGHGCLIMGGVTIHNGAVIAANSVVTKDVPPYAIVGGNPARILKYRFEEPQINKLLDIAWWNWDEQRLSDNKSSFLLDIDGFIEAYWNEAVIEKSNINGISFKEDKPVYLFFADCDEPYPIFERVVRSFCEFFKDSEARLVLCANSGATLEKCKRTLSRMGKKYPYPIDIVIHYNESRDERPLFAECDYFITSRATETVMRADYADSFGVKVFSGFNKPLFG